MQSLGSFACVDIRGGAVEFSWDIRTLDGEPLDGDPEGKCDRVREVRLCWQAVTDAGLNADPRCEPSAADSFPCDDSDSRGVTDFRVPTGPTALFIRPMCSGGLSARPETYRVPAPIVREIKEGQIATLGIVLIEIGDDTCT